MRQTDHDKKPRPSYMPSFEYNTWGYTEDFTSTLVSTGMNGMSALHTAALLMLSTSLQTGEYLAGVWQAYWLKAN